MIWLISSLSIGHFHFTHLHTYTLDMINNTCCWVLTCWVKLRVAESGGRCCVKQLTRATGHGQCGELFFYTFPWSNGTPTFNQKRSAFAIGPENWPPPINTVDFPSFFFSFSFLFLIEKFLLLLCVFHAIKVKRLGHLKKHDLNCILNCYLFKKLFWFLMR